MPPLSGVERSALLTVISRARDAEWVTPILGDRWSVSVRDSLAVDWEGLGMPRKEAFTVATRSRLLDDLCCRFIAQHPDACVIDLGCGLDDRVWRVRPPSGVTWIDLDLPAVLVLRSELGFPGYGPNHLDVAANAMDEAWLDLVPVRRPVVVVADGFFPFLPMDRAEKLVQRIVEHSSSGALLMNGYSTLARRLMPQVRAIRDLNVDVSGGTAFDDPAEPELWHPRIRLAGQFPLTQSPYVRLMPPRLRRAIHVLGWFPSLARRSDLGVLQYVF